MKERCIGQRIVTQLSLHTSHNGTQLVVNVNRMGIPPESLVVAPPHNVPTLFGKPPYRKGACTKQAIQNVELTAFLAGLRAHVSNVRHFELLHSVVNNVEVIYELSCACFDVRRRAHLIPTDVRRHDRTDTRE